MKMNSPITSAKKTIANTQTLVTPFILASLMSAA
jgi:hypothetical protein